MAYAILSTVLTVAVLQWLKAWNGIRRFTRRRYALWQYKKQLIVDCGSIIIVGRRDLPPLRSAFVELDVAWSRLARRARNANDSMVIPTWWNSSCVIVGAPGGGKSTLVKHRVLEEVSSAGADFAPMFFRLRDFAGFESIEAALATRLTMFHESIREEQIGRWLKSPKSLCVLDGLDEVAPEERENVVAQINAFAAKHCRNGCRLVITCRKEAYLDSPLNIDMVVEVLPMTDEQIREFATRWPPGFPQGKSEELFWRDVSGSAHILELARSPLLLVGGLVQYTESNRGIPDERYQYLHRVAEWLLVEWSTAQGHPADEYRVLYERLLRSLAYEMHLRETPHLPVADAQRIVSAQLPSLGVEAGRAEDVLRSLRHRTGILVADDQSRLVFAQFALQEFFAAAELSLAPIDAKLLARNIWWREAILLAIAQQADPAPSIEALFSVNELLAVTAVAEHPTPSLWLQKRAAEVAAAAAKRADKDASPAISSLLTRVTGSIADSLCAELEKTIQLDKKRARIAGAALASAGTSKATAVLARHPSAWEDALSDRGHVSESFADHLQKLIAEGNDVDSTIAVDLLASRARAGMLSSLVTALPRLTAPRAARLAAKLLTRSIRQMHSLPSEATDRYYAPVVAAAVPYVRDPESLGRTLAREMAAEAWDRTTARAHRASAFPERYRHRDALRIASRSAGISSLFHGARTPLSVTTTRVNRAFIASLHWYHARNALLALASTGLLLATQPSGGDGLFALALVLLAAVVIVAVPDSLPPWRKAVRMYEARHISVGGAVGLMLCGAAATAGVTYDISIAAPLATIVVALAARSSREVASSSVPTRALESSEALALGLTLVGFSVAAAGTILTLFQNTVPANLGTNIARVLGATTFALTLVVSMTLLRFRKHAARAAARMNAMLAE